MTMINWMKHISVYVLAGLLGTSLIAAPVEERDDKNPLGCRDVGYQYALHVLNLFSSKDGDGQSMFFLFNKQSKPLNLYQMRPQDSVRSVFLNHVIQPRQWAVLSTSEPQLNYICTLSDGKQGYGQIVDCEDVVKVCQYVRVKYGMNNRGNYWVVNSNTRGGAVNEVLHYGIIPR